MTRPTSNSNAESAEGSVALSDLQIALMRVLWQAGSATTAEVAEALRTQRDLAHTTVATLLTRLERRGAVVGERIGRQLSYRPVLTEAQVQRSMVSGLLASLFDGRATALLSHLVAEDEIGAADLERMRKLLAKAGAAKGRKHG